MKANFEESSNSSIKEKISEIMEDPTFVEKMKSVIQVDKSGKNISKEELASAIKQKGIADEIINLVKGEKSISESPIKPNSSNQLDPADQKNSIVVHLIQGMKFSEFTLLSHLKFQLSLCLFGLKFLSTPVEASSDPLFNEVKLKRNFILNLKEQQKTLSIILIQFN